MDRFALLFVVLSLTGIGCARFSQPPASQEMTLQTLGDPATQTPDTSVVLPIDEYVQRRTLKDFGEYYNARFRGYHTGDDVEYADVKDEVEVRAIADGTVLFLDWVSGYGGVMVIEHTLNDGRTVRAIYGHIDKDSATVGVNDVVVKGQRLAYLGASKSRETDRERKHLYFALYEGTDFKINGYTLSGGGLTSWINPQDFFSSYGVLMVPPDRMYDENDFDLRFTIPSGWEAEYVPSIDALNLFTLSGDGSARDRSQVFITRKSDEPHVGQYEVTKPAGTVDLPDQPDWRNQTHIATDVGEFVVAKNPDLDMATYEQLLASMRILE